MRLRFGANLLHEWKLSVEGLIMSRTVLFPVLALFAFLIRLPQLGVRPMHTDEAINAYIVGRVMAGEAYHYDPHDRHGPALAAVTVPVVRLLGSRSFSDLTEVQLRLVPVIIGTATILLLWWGAGFLGFWTSLIAAAWFAFAPLPVYYNRYFIHETLFVAATLGLILSGLQLVKMNSFFFGALAGISAALMLACKETAVLHFIALGVAVLVVQRVRRENFFIIRVSSQNITVAATVFAGIIILLFTWFGQHWKGLGDLLQAGPQLIRRAGGEGHEKPAWYYAWVLGGSWADSVFLLLATLGIYWSFRAKETQYQKARLLLAIYALAISAIYCGIPYKTPWLALNLWLPLSIMAGVGIEQLLKLSPARSYRWTVCCGAVALAALVSKETMLRVFTAPSDVKNPYAYSHPVEDLFRLEPRIAEIVHDRHLETPRIAVITADPWPLPWYFRKYPNIGYWQPGNDSGTADFYITSQDAINNPVPRIEHCHSEFFGLRPEELVVLWIPERKDKTP